MTGGALLPGVGLSFVADDGERRGLLSDLCGERFEQLAVLRPTRSWRHEHRRPRSLDRRLPQPPPDRSLRPRRPLPRRPPTLPTATFPSVSSTGTARSPPSTGPSSTLLIDDLAAIMRTTAEEVMRICTRRGLALKAFNWALTTGPDAVHQHGQFVAGGSVDHRAKRFGLPQREELAAFARQ